MQHSVCLWGLYTLPQFDMIYPPIFFFVVWPVQEISLSYDYFSAGEENDMGKICQYLTANC